MKAEYIVTAAAVITAVPLTQCNIFRLTSRIWTTIAF